MAARTQAPSGRRNTHRNTRPVCGNDYIRGSVAPKLKPQTTPKQETRPGKPSNNQSIRSNRRVRRNQERAMYMDLPRVVMLTIASVLILYPCINYLHVQSSTTTRVHHIEQMKAELEQLEAKNDTLEASINTNIDLNKIYEIAAEELGMVYAKKDRVLLYDKIESEYVKQYEDTPEY